MAVLGLAIELRHRDGSPAGVGNAKDGAARRRGEEDGVARPGRAARIDCGIAQSLWRSAGGFDLLELSAGEEAELAAVRAGVGARPAHKRAPSPAAGTTASTKARSASRSRLLRRLTRGAATPACDPPSAIHSSCILTSCAVCHR